jgi:hypothetical protein
MFEPSSIVNKPTWIIGLAQIGPGDTKRAEVRPAGLGMSDSVQQHFPDLPADSETLRSASNRDQERDNAYLALQIIGVSVNRMPDRCRIVSEANAPVKARG